MSDKKISFIGAGNMGSAIMGGIISSGLFEAPQVTAADKNAAALSRLEDSLKINTTADNTAAAKQADILFLCVKPNMFSTVIPEIADCISENTVVVSIAAGQTIARIEELFDRPIHLVRVMPNTPALVGESMSALCRNEHILDEELSMVKQIFDSLGRSEVVPESMIDAVTGISGSSPAYVYMFIEAMADAAVADGMPRDMAYTFAAQSVLGSAKMVLETKKHPGELKDMVCSPGGTTIEAVAVLEEEGFRNAVIKAQRACVKKSRDMSK